MSPRVVKRLVRRVVGPVHEWSHAEAWRLVTTERSYTELEREHRRRFSDQDHLVRFFGALQGQMSPGGPLAVRTRGTNEPLDAASVDELASQVVTSADFERSQIRVTGLWHWHDGSGVANWTIELSASREHRYPRVRIGGTGQAAQSVVRRLAELVDQYTVAAGRMRDGEPLVDPVSMAEAFKLSQSAMVTRRATWMGALAGALASLAVAGLLQLASALLP